jgi:CMP/dCMP kinase
MMHVMQRRSTEAGNREHEISAAPLIITIDGPAGTGKSTVAHMLAKRLGLQFLDTGAMYRAAALIAIENTIDPPAVSRRSPAGAGDPDAGGLLAEAIERAGMHFDWSADPPRLMLGNENARRDVSRRIRDMDVSEIVSLVAAQPAVRRVLVEQQRRIAAEHPRLVTEGRDQGSVVFPDAAVRFYLHADVDVRAGRRMAQLAAHGKRVDAERVLRDIRRRDEIDAGRTDAPLIRPEGAVDIDTGGRSAEQVVDDMEAVVRRTLGLGTRH